MVQANNLFLRITIGSVFLVALIFGARVTVLADDAEFAASMEAFLSKDENVVKLGEALERHFQKKRIQQQKESAKKEAGSLEEQFNNPVGIDIAGSATKGDPEAKITVVEFSDFQCPFCSRGKQVMEDLLREYPDDVKLVFKHHPLPFHEQAKPAARAAEAAGKQGKFWEMHDLLFINQKALNGEKYLELAEKLGLDIERFGVDLTSEETEKRINADSALAAKLGVRGTPGFFLNGVQVKGAKPLPYFKNLVERWLKKLARNE